MLFVGTVLSIQEKSVTSSNYRSEMEKFYILERHSPPFILRPFKMSVKFINVPKAEIVEHGEAF